MDTADTPLVDTLPMGNAVIPFAKVIAQCGDNTTIPWRKPVIL